MTWRPKGICPLPDCSHAALRVGPLGFLCLPHALQAAGAPPVRQYDGPGAPERPEHVREAFRAALRQSEHLAGATAPLPGRQGAHDAPDPALVAAAVEVVRGLGAVPLRTERTFGEVEGLPAVQVIPARHYAHAPSRAVTVQPGDLRVPRTARTMATQALEGGWSVRLRAVDDPPSLLLKAWRGSLYVAARWEGGKFAAGWAMRGRGQPVAMGARQMSALLKATREVAA